MGCVFVCVLFVYWFCLVFIVWVWIGLVCCFLLVGIRNMCLLVVVWSGIGCWWFCFLCCLFGVFVCWMCGMSSWMWWSRGLCDVCLIMVMNGVVWMFWVGSFFVWCVLCVWIWVCCWVFCCLIGGVWWCGLCCLM